MTRGSELRSQIAALDEELVTLRKRKTAFKGHGTSTKEISAVIDEKQRQVRSLRKQLKQKVPAAAYQITLPQGKRSIVKTLEAQKRPVQGGRASPK